MQRYNTFYGTKSAEMGNNYPMTKNLLEVKGAVNVS